VAQLFNFEVKSVIAHHLFCKSSLGEALLSVLSLG
jgi:hypothetical protein